MTEEVTCPMCCQVFQVVMPPESEMPCDLDFDCEICCRPMVIHFSIQETYAVSLAD